jgi:hypothetical protein
MRTRLGIVAVAAMLLTTAFPAGAVLYQDIELQAATDALQTAGRDTVEQLFWRSGFGASVIGGPTIAGNAGAFTTRQTAIENYTSGTTPTGVRPIFIEFAALPNASYVAGTVNASDYATQRWNFSAGAQMTGAGTLGTGAAASASLAAYLLRTNHYAGNGTQDPAAPLIGATSADGVLGLWMTEGLMDRVTAITMYGAYNGSALGAFNLTDPALNDADGSNGWQLVPDGLAVMLSSDPEPLFGGFAPSDNATSLRGTASLILGLAEIVAYADPAGAHARLFDSDPYDATLYNKSLALLASLVANNDAAHWNAVASTYTQGGGAQDTGDLALLVAALARAEKAVDNATRPVVAAARERALSALTSLANAFGVFPATFDVAGPTVTGNWSTVTLWGQAGALEAISAVYATTGLAAHMVWMKKASAGLESALFSMGSYHAVNPEPTVSAFTAGAIGATLGALRDLSLTGEEPLAIWRIVNATQWLFTSPPLVLGGATHPPVIGASFGWNASSQTYLPQAADFSAWGGLYAAYEMLTIGPEFLTAVGGGVSTTLRASLLLHNATASQVGASIDALDQQIATLNAQLASLQASFDALNANVTAVSDRLNLSLENESISAGRIAGLQANLTTLRSQLNNTVENLTTIQQLYTNQSTLYGDQQTKYNESNINLTLALQNATALASRVNVTLEQAEQVRQAMNTTNATRDQQAKDLAYAQNIVGFAVLGGILAGIGLLLFLQRFVMLPRSEKPKDDPSRKGSSKDEKKGEKKDETKDDDEHDHDEDDDEEKDD